MTDVISTHEKIRENWLKMTGQLNDKKNAKEIEAAKISQLDRIEMILQSLVDKVAALDLIVRQPYSNMRRRQGKSEHNNNHENVMDAIKTLEERFLITGETVESEHTVDSSSYYNPEPPPDPA